MKKTYGFFDDGASEYVVTTPLTPMPWVNYIGNSRLSAFISQQAGGLAFYKEPQTRRLTRYHWLPAPADRPGFYIYVRDEQTGSVWNPHFAPTCTPLDHFETRHGLGYTTASGKKDGVSVSARYFIPPHDDVMLWDVRMRNETKAPRAVTLCSYAEFGLLEFMREMFWCYLKNQIAFAYAADRNWITYNYHCFEAPFTPAIFFSCTRQADGFECSRDRFCGPGGSLERPGALQGLGFSGSQLSGGGHGCGTLAHTLTLAAGEEVRLAFALGVADDWAGAERLRDKMSSVAAIDTAWQELAASWQRKAGSFQVTTGDADFDRCVNVWNPLNCQITLERTRDISPDHMGLDGQRYRDTMQDALAMANLDPVFARERIRMVLAAQGKDGSGCFSFYPFAAKPHYGFEPDRCDNTVWPIMTVTNLVHETGEWGVFEEVIPFRDGGEATVYGHILLGLEYIWGRRGPHGLPTLFGADWNDGLAVFMDPAAESVMLGMQMVYACKQFKAVAERLGRADDAAWCDTVVTELDRILNSDVAWDGGWYRRLLLSNGMKLGSHTRPQGQIYLEPQVWAVMAGVARGARAWQCMDAVRERLNTRRGLMIHTPPYTGIPNPDDPLTSNVPGTGENGSIFCHANTWAIIAECILGRGDYAYEYYRKLMSSVAAEEEGHDHWGREPYVFVSSVTGPARGEDFGKAGISWLTGTASWMYVAATQALLGIEPVAEGLKIHPCLPQRWPAVKVTRRFRGKAYAIEITQNPRTIIVNGARVDAGTIIPA